MKILPFLFSLSILSAPITKASIEWEQKEITVAVHPVQLKKEVVFKFHNTGKNPIEFLSMRPSCGCLTIHPEKKRYLPDESGTLKVVFDLSNRTGTQKKSVNIVTSDKPNQTQSLYLKINIPDAYQFSAKRVTWKSSQDNSPQTVTLTNVSSEAIFIGKVTSSDKRFKVKLNPLREGFEYQLELIPEPDLSNVRSVIRIQTIPPAGMKESKSYKIYTYIK